MVPTLGVADLTVIGSLIAVLVTAVSTVYAIRLRPKQEHREDTKVDLEEDKVTAERFQKLWDRVDALEKRNTELWNENQALRQQLLDKGVELVQVIGERDTARRERAEALAKVGPLQEQVQRLQSEVEQLRAEVNGNGKDGH